MIGQSTARHPEATPRGRDGVASDVQDESDESDEDSSGMMGRK